MKCGGSENYSVTALLFSAVAAADKVMDVMMDMALLNFGESSFW